MLFHRTSQACTVGEPTYDTDRRHDDIVIMTPSRVIVRDVKRSVAFYRDVLDATVLREGKPTLLRLAVFRPAVDSIGSER